MTAPRSLDQPLPPRSALTCAADFPAPEGLTSSRDVSGAGLSLSSDGDLAALPSGFVRRAPNRFIDPAIRQGGEAVSRVAHNHDVAGSNPAPATSCNRARDRVARRESEPSFVLPPPHGPP